jgi:hypothetical protein
MILQKGSCEDHFLKNFIYEMSDQTNPITEIVQWQSNFDKSLYLETTVSIGRFYNFWKKKRLGNYYLLNPKHILEWG